MTSKCCFYSFCILLSEVNLKNFKFEGPTFNQYSQKMSVMFGHFIEIFF